VLQYRLISHPYEPLQSHFVVLKCYWVYMCVCVYIYIYIYISYIGSFVFTQVAILFDNKLLRGNRCTKKDSEGFDAFGTPNMMPLAELETSIQSRLCTTNSHACLHFYLLAQI